MEAQELFDWIEKRKQRLDDKLRTENLAPVERDWIHGEILGYLEVMVHITQETGVY